jgi:16S rRNA (guanine966-N2)-methyltransferase
MFASLISLRGSLDGAAFLDLYAGSGAVGLEAASRGACRVVLVENAAAALRAIRTNVETLALPGVEVRAEPVQRALSRPPAAVYDVVFCDPPYSEGVAEVLDVLAGPGWLEPDALVVVERATRDPQLSWPDGLEPVQSRRYGDSTLWYGRRS